MESWCPNCHKRIVCTSGMCPSCYVPTVTSFTATYCPAPKEKEMEFAKTTCAGCGATLLNLESCTRCTSRVNDLRAVWDRAYFAALTGVCGIDGVWGADAVHHAETAANATVAGWPFGRDDTVRKAVDA